MTKIGVDIDEILAETVNGFLLFYNQKHGTSHQFNDVTDYSFGKQFGLTPDEEIQNIKKFFTSKYFPELKTVDGSQEAIKTLAEDHELFAVSSRPELLLPQTEAWLDLHFNKCFSEIILTNSHFDASRTKSSVCRSKGLDIFIEDQIKYAEDCAEICSSVYLLDKPWNQTKEIRDNIIRAKSWDDILRRVESSK